ncbi:family 43 glycosylhydrolase [Paenibacillus sp. CC-CFT747]|nr:family 43 glycosylhydrolase [Paenibacillus sp. CC-CFT747]
MNRWLGKSLSFALVLSCLAGPFPSAGPAHASPKEEVLLQEGFDSLQFTALERIGQDAADPSNSKQISVTPSSIALTDRRSAGNQPSTYVQLKMNDAVSFKPAIRASNYTLNVDLVDDPVPASRPNKVLWVRSSNNDVNRLVGFVFKDPQKGRIVYEADVYNPGKQEVKLYLEANSPIALRDDIQQVISGVEPSLRIQPNGNVRLPNDQSIGQVESSRWYRVRLTVNTETGLFKTQVYDKETEVLTASYEYNVPGKLRVDFAENGLLHVGLANKIYGPEGLYLDNVKIYKDLSESSTLAAKEASFYLDSPEDTPVEFNSNGNRVTAIRHGNEKLQEGVDYTVEGSRVVLHKEALQAIEQAVSGDVEDLFYSNAHPSSFSADPSVLKASDGQYYLYPTSGFKVWSSTDLFHWELAGSVWPEGTWGKSAYWAPEVVEHDGKYYMYYTASIGDSADKKYVGVAIGDSPTGPFKDIGHPIHQQFPHIDGHLFQDDDGRKYLYFSRAASHNEVDGLKQSWTYVAELNDDMISLKSDPVFLIKAEQDWELQSLPENMIWNEGPEMIKHNGLYYLMYSANSYARPQYSVGYATSTSPMGPFVKYENNPILSREEWVGTISGPGHHHFAKSPDGQELIMVYHTHVDPILAGGNRQIYIDRMGFREDGTIYVNGPTLTDQPMPSGVRGLPTLPRKRR